MVKDDGFVRLRLQKVSSSIAAAGYNRARREMQIGFRSRGADPVRTYNYGHVPPAAARALELAASPGQFVNWEIKPNYPAREVTGPRDGSRRAGTSHGRRKNKR